MNSLGLGALLASWVLLFWFGHRWERSKWLYQIRQAQAHKQGGLPNNITDRRRS